MAGEMKTSLGVESAQFEIVVIRADGTREDLGVVSYYHRNPLRRLVWRIRNRRKG